MTPSPQPTIHPDGTPEWGALTRGDDLVQVADNEVTIISDGSAGGTIRLPLDRAHVLAERIAAAVRYNAQKQDDPQ